jgi:ribosomal protein S9
MTEATLEVTRQKPLWATGRRKSAVARVRVVPGEGRVVVNGKTVEDFFGGNERQKAAVMAPFHLGKTLAAFDLFISTSGGGSLARRMPFGWAFPGRWLRWIRLFGRLCAPRAF